MTKTFGPESTTDEVLEGIDLAGKRILVTGVSAGIGVETARSLQAHGAEVVGAARDLDKARRALKEAGAADMELVKLDLASLASVRAAADSLVADGRPFDVIIANAGIMACPLGKTVDGFETQFGTNHLGHFVFVNRIASLLKPGGRVVVLSSSAHHYADIDLEDPNFDNKLYTEFVAYGSAKTANALFAVEFDRRYKDSGIRAASVHPGGIMTELSRYVTQEMLVDIMSSPLAAAAPAIVMKSVPAGAATSVWTAVVADGDEVGGRYCDDCQVAKIGVNVQAYAQDGESAKALWAKSEEMVGETFPAPVGQPVAA
jgi:NAD(P)-dependent dehydrogenase (short-subunit alcohol dehydrogenase family)